MTDATSSIEHDPRVVRSRLAVRLAIVALLEEEGPGAITHQRVADRAGIGRATVYRHWPRPQDLIREAIELGALRLFSTVTGPIRDRLRAGVRRLADDLRTPVTTAAVATMLEQAIWDAEVRQRRSELAARLIAETQSALLQAVEAGELTGTPEPSRLLAQILGPCMYTNLILDESVSDELIDTVVDAALAPWLA